MKFYWILIVSIATPCFVCLESLKLIDNGYENLYVVIQENVPENDKLLGRIKEIFTDASNLLYIATHRRAYFKNLKVIIPGNWAKNDSYKIVSGLTSLTSHIRIGNNEMKEPMTVGSEMCGQEGLYLYLHHQEFVLQEGLTLWGTHDKVIVHEWGHLRWGLRDEYPTLPNPGSVGNLIKKDDSDGINPGGGDGIITGGGDGLTSGSSSGYVNFYMSDGEWKPVVEFCDKDDDSTPEYMRHNSQAINEQNRDCDGRSAWEVMREHEDFKNDNNPPSESYFPPEVKMELLQQGFDRSWVFVLDTSGSMRTGDRISNLHNVVKYIIEDLLPDSSWLSMVDFDSGAVVLTPFVQLDTALKRQQLIPLIPSVAGGGTCIPCGLDLAVEILNDFESIGSTEGTEIILITDGGNNEGNLELATQNCVNAGVVVHCVAVTAAADERLVNISARTGGRIFTLADNGTVSMAAVFTEIILGGIISNSQTAATIKNEKTVTAANIPANITFRIDAGIGKDTTVTVITSAVTDIAMSLTGSNNSEEYFKSESSVQSLSLVVPGILETGQYIATVTTSTSAMIEVIVTSKPISSGAEVIRPVIRLSTNEFDFMSSSMPVMYVVLRKGESPVKKAIVKAFVEDSLGTKTCELDLLDDGLGADVQPEDGIYTAVLIHKCQGGDGRHSSKVIIEGTDETKVAHFAGRRSAIIDDETPITAETPTGIFERVAVADAYTVSNYVPLNATTDLTPPGRISDIQVIDIHSGIPSLGLTRNYTIAWTATGDDMNVGQASAYEMRISNDQNVLRFNFTSAELLNVTGAGMTPNVSGKVERLVMTVSSDDGFVSTTSFAIVAIDDVGNRGPVSNIISITVGSTNHFYVFEEECTNDCYDIVKDCGKILIINNGQINFTNVLTTAGSTVPVVCDIGYELAGGMTVTCMDDGTWSNDVSCEIIGCGGISIKNGELEFPEGTDYNAKAFIKCSDGYHLTGVNTVRCMANGIWDKNGTCEINDCGTSETVEHGWIDFTNAYTTFGHSVPVTCDSGYRLLGAPAIVCLYDGTWSDDVRCDPVDCRPTTVGNGELDYPGGTTFNSTAIVACDAGYHINGPGTIRCLSNGIWSSESECVINDCETEFRIPNGQINFTGTQTTYGQSVPVTCNIGYKRSGGTHIMCLADGTWSKSITCEKVGCGGTSVANGMIEFPYGTDYSAVGYVTCNLGFHLASEDNRIVCMHTGEWNSSIKCEINDCGNNFTLPHGHADFSSSSSTYGQLVPVICDKGYQLRGGTHIQCMPHGSWSMTASCEIVDCGLTTTSNGTLDFAEGTKYNAIAQLNCDVGFRTTGTGFITCLETELWSTDSNCKIIDCGRDVSIPNGYANFTSAATTYGNTAPVDCNTGYKIKGQPYVECRSDGLWSQTPVCELQDCGTDIQIKNGHVAFSDGKTTYKESVPIVCDEGFRLNAKEEITCLANGTWSSVPDCIIDEGRSAGQQVIIIVASSCGVLFLLVIGLLSLSVVNRVKNMTLSKKGHLTPVHRKYVQSEASFVEANPDYDMDYRDWNAHNGGYLPYTNPVRKGIYLPQKQQPNGFLNGFC